MCRHSDIPAFVALGCLRSQAQERAIAPDALRSTYRRLTWRRCRPDGRGCSAGGLAVAVGVGVAVGAGGNSGGSGGAGAGPGCCWCWCWLLLPYFLNTPSPKLTPNPVNKNAKSFAQGSRMRAALGRNGLELSAGPTEPLMRRFRTDS